ncbi:hypothetical protein Tco_0497142 [Tanacetum coccineum]
MISNGLRLLLMNRPSFDFSTGSPSITNNTEPPVVGVEPMEQLVENIADSGDSLVRQENLVIHSGSVAARIKDRKCRTRGSSKPPIKRRLHSSYLHRQVVIDNAVNRRAQELLKVVEQIRGEYFDNNQVVNILRENIFSLFGEVNEHKASMNRMLTESKKWADYQVSLLALESKVASLKDEKAKLEATEVSLRQEVENVKRDRAKVVLKVAPYVVMELVQSDEMGKLVAKLVSSAIFFGRCHAFEEVESMKEPFDLSKVKSYRASYKQEHTKVGNDLATAIFPFLSEVIADPHAPIEALLSMKPHVLHCPALTRTHVPTSSDPSQKATPSSTPMS